MSGFDFLILVLQCSNNFILNAFFNFASVNFFLATWFRFSFCLRGLVVLLFCSPCNDWIFWFFKFKFSNCSPLKIIFSVGFSFLIRSVCNHGALKMRLHVVALPASFILNAFFQFCFSYFLRVYMVHVQFSAVGSCGSFVLFSMGGVEFLNFFVWNLQPVSPLKLIFSEGPQFFERSVCNIAALKKRLHVEALPASLAISWPAEST